jgi:broad specificity phosphatase PhoE
MLRLVYVARHGETDWNAANRWQGRTDIPLNDRGRAQARALAGRLRLIPFAAVVSSDLSRAYETARIVGSELKVALAYVDPELRERSFGVFEGLTRAECEAQYPGAWRAWLEHRTAPRGGEASEALRARMVAAVARVCQDVARDDAPALVVTHGGSLRAVVAAVTGEMPPPVENTEVWVLAWEAASQTLASQSSGGAASQSLHGRLVAVERVSLLDAPGGG